ncbi:MAG: thiamine-phosphate kinase [Desulfobulbaceae bacterium A2]|nr:MAG: thiamine-phosphate kinase [Desulfobulbaceae bacterium A2]
MLSERALIEQIAGRAQGEAPDLLQGIGDDCAVIAGPANTVWLLSTDTLVAGVHFDLAWHPPRLLGRKAVAVNLSDVAAMGGEPRFLLLALALPATFPAADTEAILCGLYEACRESACLLVGGDTVHSPVLALSLTVIGQQPKAEVVYRHGARVGDLIWVSGWLGSAAAGLELCRRGLNETGQAEFAPLISSHLTPSPRCRLGRELSRRGLAHAMQDISDGIATDLAHICTASQIGARIQAELLPSHPLLSRAAEQLGLVPLDLMLRGGEDYELLWTASPGDTAAILALAEEMMLPCRQIGTIVDRPGVQLCQQEPHGTTTTVREIAYQGYDHFSAGTTNEPVSHSFAATRRQP